MLTISAGIFITCAVISFSILVMHEGLFLGNAFVSGINERERDYREYNIAKYDSEILTGAEVINFTKRNEEDMEIVITNGMGSRTFNRTNKFNISANFPANGFYVEPYDDYVGQLVRNTNGKIDRMIFKYRKG